MSTIFSYFFRKNLYYTREGIVASYNPAQIIFIGLIENDGGETAHFGLCVCVSVRAPVELIHFNSHTVCHQIVPTDPLPFAYVYERICSNGF